MLVCVPFIAFGKTARRNQALSCSSYSSSSAACNSVTGCSWNGDFCAGTVYGPTSATPVTQISCSSMSDSLGSASCGLVQGCSWNGLSCTGTVSNSIGTTETEMPVVDAVATVEEEINAVENKMPVVDATEYLIQVCSMTVVVETCAEVNAEAAIRKWLPDMPATTSEMKPAMCSLVCTQTQQCAMYSTSLFSGHAHLPPPPPPPSFRIL